MSYARWATKEEVVNATTKISKGDIPKSGIEVMYDDDHLYIDSSDFHNMIIGVTGSGKTQVTVLPHLYTSIMAEDSFIVNDPRGEIYEKMGGLAKEKGYSIKVLNFADTSKGNNFNPLYLPYQLYKNGNIDAAIEMLEDVGYYIVCDSHKTDADPFWENSAINLFTGIALYLFEKAKPEEINLNSIVSLGTSIDEFSNKINEMDKNSLVYSTLAPVITAPDETRNSIVSVFLQKARLITSRESVSKILCNDNMNLENIKKEKTAIFVISDGRYSNIILPTLINEVCKIVDVNKDTERRLNILLDEFDSYKPIKDFNNMLSIARSLRIRFNIYIQSILELEYVYGKKEAEFIRMCFGNIYYLLANDTETLDLVSNLCGKFSENEMLVTKEDLKTLKTFEAIILKIRMYPIKTKLLPYYEMGIENINAPEIKPLEYNNIVIYK